MCSSSTSLFFFLFLFPIYTHLLTLTTAQPNFLYNVCDNLSGNYTANSTYRTNLNRALSPIDSQSSITNGFYHRSAGANSSDRANVIGLCRGDVKPAACRSCLNDSSLELIQQCPNQKEAIGWYDNCMLRYSNRSIFGAVDSNNSIIFFNQNNVTANVAEFDGLVSDLLSSLADRAAAAGGSRPKFATGHVSGPNAETIYGLVQCTPDLSRKACNSCLADFIGVLPSYLGGRIGGRIIGPSCNFRYETRLFYNITSADEELTLPPEPAPTPTPTPTPTPAHAGVPPSATPPPATPNSAPPVTNRTETTGGTDKTSRTVVETTLVAALIVAFISLF